MKNILYAVVLIAVVTACGSTKDKDLNDDNLTDYNNAEIKGDTVKIENDSVDYEITIFEPGFRSFLATQQPRGYYSQSFLEQHNRRYVVTYNGRVLSSRWSRDLYTVQIDYEQRVDYGYEVNYLLYNYFVYFMEKYNQRL